MNTRMCVITCLALAATVAGSAWAEPTLEWIRYRGQGGLIDYGWGASADGLGNVYIAGSTMDGLFEPLGEGYNEGFLAKYDGNGTLQWGGQFHTEDSDSAGGYTDVSADGMGSVYTAGGFYGIVNGAESLGVDDALVARYDASGTLDWMRTFGSTESDIAYGVSADGLGNVYIAGSTAGNLDGPNIGSRDAFLAKFDEGGTQQWIRQFGTTGLDQCHGVSTDGVGNVYVSGVIAGSENSGFQIVDGDAFLSKYNADGALQWTQQVGASGVDSSEDVFVDGLGNVYITGYTAGSLEGPNIGDRDAFLVKYDEGGTLQWMRQFGTEARDEGHAVSADGLGNVYITGQWENTRYLGISAGDALLAKFDESGEQQWIQRVSSKDERLVENGNGISTDGRGSVFITGEWGKYYPADGVGKRTPYLFVAKYSDLPTLPGDFDRNGTVDGGDFLAWQRGESPDSLSPLDLATWQANFGTNDGAAVQRVAVPEPTAALLVGLACIACALHFRRASGPVVGRC